MKHTACSKTAPSQNQSAIACFFAGLLRSGNPVSANAHRPQKNPREILPIKARTVLRSLLLSIALVGTAYAQPPSFPQVAARLQELGYLPFAPMVEHLPDGQSKRVYFFRFPVPEVLQRTVDQYPWDPGNPFFRGALIQFERQNGILHSRGVSEGRIHAQVTQKLDTGTQDRWRWEWVLVDKYAGTSRPEELRVWRTGDGFVYHTVVNTGVLGSTPDGTWPVYQRLPTTTMRGVFPIPISWQEYRSLRGLQVPQWGGSALLQPARGTVNGHPVRWSPYNDPDIRWVNYFDAGRGIHYYPRASYGFPQSAGCVEEPYAAARHVFALLHYGVPVTIASNPRMEQNNGNFHASKQA